MIAEHQLTEERRARMAAERLLAQKEAELNAANRMLSRHALTLSEEVVEKREEVAVVRGDLARANTEVDIAKRRLWNSIQSIEDGFAVFDADSRLVIANSAYLLPFDGLECIRPGAHYQEVIEAALAEGVVDIEGATPGQWREQMLARWFSPAPEPRVIRLWNGTWVRLVDQRAPGGDTVCLGLNITGTMKREAALTEAREKAEAASRAKSAFLANMSHEIRTPMNGVVGMADLLAESGLDDEQRLYVDTIRSSGQSLLTIINDVLDYSKIEAAKLSLHIEPFDLERIILDVIHLMSPSLREKGLAITLDYDMFLPTGFEGDPVRLRQILTNLVGNAVKFTPAGHVLVRVVGLPGTGEGPAQVSIVVEDSGIGIPADKLTQIFGEFSQVEDGRDRNYEGTGLGLAITRQLVELMGGRIWVESTPGEGSAFGVRLPLPAIGPATPPALPGWLRRVLLAMEDALARDILAKRLAALGLEVHALASGEDPRALPAPDAIVAQARPDGSIPAALAASGLTAPLVLVAALGDDRPARDRGAAALLTRPISRGALVAALSGLEPPAPLLLTDPVTDEGTATATAPVFGSVRGTAPSTAPARQMRVLAAEDNKTNQLVFSKLVKSCDIALRFAANGAEAVAAFDTERPDLIFMDISMPGMDGKAATRRIRQIEAARGLPPTRIVALTAHAMAGDAEEIMSHGLDAHLTKPFQKAAILTEITRARPQDARPPVPEESQNS
ncbi:ATP-binding protein [Sinisalibacter aestuarii]|uniref:histidine kinase n=1 Tax=Sinisalibacter aestuarii TaxID=2949426 RepID=A0ABQ5LWS7_9RHOB|nr:ATP-binding protein [Sinisalibacter aestuarii]GKY88836.1 sensor histidine kinase [Sinisalibacter aestuarii]